MPKLPLVQILSHLDLHALGERAMVLSVPGPEGAVKTRAEVVSQIVDEVDALIPFHLFPPWGTVVDLLDGPVVKLLVNLILMIGQARKHKPESSVHADLKAHVDAAIAEADAGHSKTLRLRCQTRCPMCLPHRPKISTAMDKHPGDFHVAMRSRG